MMDINEYVKKLRSEKDKPGTPANLIYAMLEKAHPTVREVIEYQAAQMMAAGEKLSIELEKALATDEGKAQFRSLMTKISSTRESVLSEVQEEEND